MYVNIQKILETDETIRIIYPSKTPVFDGRRALSHSNIGEWRGSLSNDLNNKTLLSDIIANQQNFNKIVASSDKIRKIQAIDPDSLKLSEFFLGGKILLFIDKHKTFSDKIYLQDRIENFEYLGGFFISKLREFTDSLDTSEYGYNHVIVLSLDITI